MADFGQESTESPAASTPAASSGQKRKNEDGAQGTRAKRNRYISIACNECKRRKIKCNGQTPCQRCNNLHLECLYAPNCCSNSFKDSDEYKQMKSQISSLQDQVNTLNTDVHSWRHGSGTLELPPIQPKPPSISAATHSSVGTPESPSRNRVNSRPKPPKFHGPTSSTFNIDVAKSSLHTMGISAPEEPPEDEPAPKPSPIVVHPDKDPLWSISREEAVRLLNVYEDEISTMHPVTDMEATRKSLNMLYTFMEAAIKNRLFQPGDGGPDHLINDSACIVKMVLAISLTLEGTGESQVGQELFETVRPVAEQRLWSSEVDFNGLLILALISMYFFHRDDETQAWRFIGIVGRMCVQLGLHRHNYQIANFAEGPERDHANVFFWSVFVLDRRWSYGTGMPFAIQESEIDPELPEPEQPLYLKAMITYSRVGSKLWASTSRFDGSSTSVDCDEIKYQDYQILNWHRSLPESLQFISPSSAAETPAPDRWTRRLRVLLYLRANATRIAIYRRVLHSATTIKDNLAQAQTVVSVAQDTIRVLTHLARNSDIYHTQQILFNYFTAGALAVIFLAVAHAPAIFSSTARDEFYMALDLVQGFRARSYVSQRLWRTIRSLKDIGPKLGLFTPRQPQSIASDPDPSTGPINNTNGNDTDTNDTAAAAAMADLAAQAPVLEHSPYPPPHHQQHTPTPHHHASLTPNPPPHSHYSPAYQPQPQMPTNNGFAISSELTSLFEAAGGFLGPNPQGQARLSPHGHVQDINGYPTDMGDDPGAGQLGAETYAGEEELNRIMRELF